MDALSLTPYSSALTHPYDGVRWHSVYVMTWSEVNDRLCDSVKPPCKATLKKQESATAVGPVWNSYLVTGMVHAAQIDGTNSWLMTQEQDK